ncbi:MAG: clpA, partial [Nevskia sp.]|nr:clpA [Nevskia sp.]
LLLQVMDHGTLTDNNGRAADFRNVILVMTTNAGAEESSRRSMGFSEANHTTDALEVIRRSFSPEFRNRLDAIIPFAALGRNEIARVVDKFLMQLEEQLAAKHVQMEVEPEAREWLAEHGYDVKMGARPMSRTIQDSIKRPLAEELLFGKLAHGGHVLVKVDDDDKIAFEIEAKDKSSVAAEPA